MNTAKNMDAGRQNDGGANALANNSRWNSPAVLAHVVPFLAWLSLMWVLDRIGSDGAWKYAVRALLVTVLLLYYRPWRWYEHPRVEALLPGVLGGVLVFLIWVLPEMRHGPDPPLLQELYLRFGILPFGKLPPESSSSLYAPAACGWLLTGMRLLGSAFVIAAAEEFFWRGFLCRRLVDRDFSRVPLGLFDSEAFWITCVLFGLEHHRLLAGVAAGIVYGYLVYRTRTIWAALIAHIVTNLLLGIFVIATGSYAFW